MIKEKIKKWLNINDLENKISKIDDIQRDIQVLKEEISASKSEFSLFESRFDAISKKLSKLSGKNFHFDLTDSELQILKVLQSNNFMSNQDLANILSKKTQTIRSHINRIKSKIFLEVKNDGRRKLYRLPKHLRNVDLEKINRQKP